MLVKQDPASLSFPSDAKAPMKKLPFLKNKASDTELALYFDPKRFPSETKAYLQIKLKEKLIVQIIQNLVEYDPLELREFMKEKLCQAHIDLEIKFKFTSNALVFLLKMFDTNIKKIIRDRQSRKNAVVAMVTTPNPQGLSPLKSHKIRGSKFADIQNQKRYEEHNN